MTASSPLPAAVDALRRNWDSKHWWNRQINSRLLSRYYSVTAPDGDAVLSEEWDNLVILDGCRYDLFERTVDSFDVDGELESRESRGSTSFEFLRNNFAGQSVDDIVYVTANPFVKTELDDTAFHAIDHVWLDRWDEELETVLAETMVERTIYAQETYPNKRIISHFMQPHHPFVGEIRIESDRGYIGARSRATDKEYPEWESIWAQFHHGKIDKETLWEAYRSNLEYALESVSGLVDKLDGQTVLTSDHGNAFGERAEPFPTRVYGHAPGVCIPALTTVPWFICESDSTKEIVSEQSDSKETDVQGDVIEERLKSLGYK